jgi:hypothetical protein
MWALQKNLLLRENEKLAGQWQIKKSKIAELRR